MAILVQADKLFITASPHISKRGKLKMSSNTDNHTALVLSEEDFKGLNPLLFGYATHTNQLMDRSRIIKFAVGSKEVLVHARVLVHSEFLFESFNNGSIDDVCDQAPLPGVGVQEFKLVMLAMYGINCPILGFNTFKGVDYIHALCLARDLRCAEFVYQSLCDCTRGHFHLYKHWKSIPFNPMTTEFHRDMLLDVYKAYKAYRKRGAFVPHAFREHAFGILVLETCPEEVYTIYREQLGGRFWNLLGGLHRRKTRGNPFSANEVLLFTRPEF
ncbi:hypothetical protein F5Y17DRAFT_472754 [Xylariaceae sp. FL0594]|nr:hypothetical protein F5Y17DRAFT_472754 [Xylariaceae sp. FL0594]